MTKHKRDQKTREPRPEKIPRVQSREFTREVDLSSTLR